MRNTLEIDGLNYWKTMFIRYYKEGRYNNTRQVSDNVVVGLYTVKEDEIIRLHVSQFCHVSLLRSDFVQGSYSHCRCIKFQFHSSLLFYMKGAKQIDKTFWAELC